MGFQFLFRCAVGHCLLPCPVDEAFELGVIDDAVFECGDAHVVDAEVAPGFGFLAGGRVPGDN